MSMHARTHASGRRPRRLRLRARLAALAPWATLAILCGFSSVLPNHVGHDAGAAQRKAEVAEAMAAAPFFIGAWVGRDEEVPPEAQKLLRPNAILSRFYQKPGGAWVRVLVVHCGDARDMIGHYPPVCYPSSGWVALDGDGPPHATIRLRDGVELPVQSYGFRRMHEHGREVRIRIFNAFVLPDGSTTRNISDINRQSERLAVAVQGVAQLQVITSTDVSRAEAVTAAAEVLDGLRDLLDALRVGEREDSFDT